PLGHRLEQDRTPGDTPRNSRSAHSKRTPHRLKIELARKLGLDNTDGRGDPHWGWPDPRGTFDVAGFANTLSAAGLGDIPVMLEVYPRFEDDDRQVRDLLISSVEHCRPHFAPAG
ncbi:MAG: hypothetical protein ACRDTX_29935, partial [Pseudonocardiaceae bacterium]